MARPQVLATRRLLPKPMEDEQLLARAMKEEAQLAQNKPDRIKSRKVSFAALQRHARGKRKYDPRMPTTEPIVQVQRWSMQQEGRERATGLEGGGESHGDLSEEEPQRCIR